MKLLLILSVGLLLNCTSTTEKNSPKTSPAIPDKMQGVVERHNYYRDLVGVPDVVWSDELAAYAQKWADEMQRRNCAFKHRPQKGEWAQKYGESIYRSTGMENTAAKVVDAWAAEKNYFDYKKCNYNNFTCGGKTVGHYTQMVWKDTRRIGCAISRCGRTEFWVCNYDPPGNYVGEKPY